MANPLIFPKIPANGVRVVCNDGLCKPVYVGARTSGEIVDTSGRPIVGAAMVLPQHVGLDMESAAQEGVEEARHLRESRVTGIVDRIIRR